MITREIAVEATRISGMQKLEELYSLLCYLELSPPSKVVEIGSSRGGTFFAFSRVATSGAVLVSVDIQQSDQIKEMLFPPSQTIHLVEGDSHDPQIRQRVKDLIIKADLLHIDADHTPEAVNADWEDYHDIVEPSGHVVFHDISDGGPIGDLFNKLSHEYWSIKFIEKNGNDGWGGIGVLRV